MNNDDLHIFSIFNSANPKNVDRTATLTRIQSQLIDSLTADDLTLLLSTLSEHPNWFRRRDFEIYITHGEGGRASQPLLSFDGDFNPDVGLLEDMTQRDDLEVQSLSMMLHRGEYADAAELLYDLTTTSVEDVLLDLSVNRDSVMGSILDECDFNIDGVEFCLWESPRALSNWVCKSYTTDIFDEIFSRTLLPYHVFVEPDGCGESDYLGYQSASSLLNGELDEDEVEESKTAYNAANADLDSRLETPSGAEYPISPLIFDIVESRSIYRPCFLYTSFVLLSESSSLTGDDMEIENITYRHRLECDINLHNNRFDDEKLSDLYSLAERTLDSSQGSINHWREAVTRFCGSIEEVPDKRKQITHYQGFLRDEAAVEELEKVQEAIDDAIGLTQTLSDSISNATQSLSSNIQTIVFALIGAIIGNFVLILRYSESQVLIPFSIVAISGILIFYLPIVQDRINNTAELMTNREQDFLLHFNSIRSQVGDSIYDFESLDERREEYIRMGEDALINSQNTISRVVVLLLLSWVVIQSYTLIVTTSIIPGLEDWLINIGMYDGGSAGGVIEVTSVFSAIPSGWILYKFYVSPTQQPISSHPNTNLKSDHYYSYFSDHPYGIPLILLAIIASSVYGLLVGVF